MELRKASKGAGTQRIFSVKTLLGILVKKPLSKKQAAEQLGIDQNATTRWINCLHAKPDNLIYISNWIKSGHIWVAQYSFGPDMPDVPKPKPVDDRVRSRLYRRRVRGTDEVPVIIKPNEETIRHVTGIGGPKFNKDHSKNRKHNWRIDQLLKTEYYVTAD
jgi:hypothetical protein